MSESVDAPEQQLVTDLERIKLELETARLTVAKAITFLHSTTEDSRIMVPREISIRSTLTGMMAITHSNLESSIGVCEASQQMIVATTIPMDETQVQQVQ